ncbi:helix-turn-helix domain-containing protein [Nocardiopsis coralliicola]
MDNDTLYSIGDAARRSGLSVSAVRFYADEGIVAPTGTSQAGHRLYDIGAIAALELVRTLRELGTDLPGIRGYLSGGTTLHGLLTAHLAVVERQERTLRARRAVLRSLTTQGATPAQAALMHRLVSMTDEEREQIIDDFWNDVGRGLDTPGGLVDRNRGVRPVLPADPTLAQLEAWIELGDLLQDTAFREEVRTALQGFIDDSTGQVIASPSFQGFIYGTGTDAMSALVALHSDGEPPSSPRVQDAARQLAEGVAALSGDEDTRQLRDRVAAGLRQVPEIERTIAEEKAAAGAPPYDDAHERYLMLVAAINGTGDAGDLPWAWIADALAAPAASP